MTASVTWVTGDRCPGCGGQLTETSTDTSVSQECRSCGWAVIWAPDPARGEQ